MYKGKLTVPQWIQLRQIKNTNLSLNTLNIRKGKYFNLLSLYYYRLYKDNNISFKCDLQEYNYTICDVNVAS